MKYDVLIIGGGASGLACAARLINSEKKLNICIVEAGDRIGRKLATTGNGQGNVSNLDLNAEHFHGGNNKLVSRIACTDPFYACNFLFDCLFTADEKGRIYPSGRQASALCDGFIRRLKDKCEILLSTKVTDIDEEFNVKLSSNTTISAEYIVLCVGGKAQKQFKTDGSSYRLVEKFGHTLTLLYPSLVQLKTQTQYIKTLKGIRADCAVTLYAGNKKLGKTRGDVVFTDYGVSGNAVFALSPLISGREVAELSLEFLPEISSEKIIKNLRERKLSGCPDSELLSGTLHNQIGRAIIARAASDDEKTIVHTLKNFILPVTGTLGFDYAQVTKGGINMSGISDELESKFKPNLFFAGEVLDVDGDCGGYNLHWAFTSGMHVADAILKRL